MKITEEQMNEFLSAIRKMIEDMPDPSPIVKSDIQWPQNGDSIYWFDGIEDICEYMWVSSSWDYKALKHGTLFRTREEAKRHVKRIQSMKPSFMSEVGQEVWFASPDGMGIFESHFSGNSNAWKCYHLGQIHPTKESAEAWLTEYQDVWMTK